MDHLDLISMTPAEQDAFKLALSFIKPGRSMQDDRRRSLAWEAASNALRSYDGTKGNLSAYVRLHTLQVLTKVRQSAGLIRYPRTQTGLESYTEYADELDYEHADFQYPDHTADELMGMRRDMHLLSAMQRYCVVARHCQGKTLREISMAVYRSRQGASDVANKALSILRSARSRRMKLSTENAI